MNFNDVDSSSIAAVAYDQQTATLGIRFHAQREYRYWPVPERQYQELLAADSLGRFFVSRIRNAGYNFERVR